MTRRKIDLNEWKTPEEESYQKWLRKAKGLDTSTPLQDPHESFRYELWKFKGQFRSIEARLAKIERRLEAIALWNK